MILRKPYAFFIKNFKFFHLILCILSGILLYRTSLIYGFLKEFIKTNPNVIGKELTDSLFSNSVYLLITFLILINLIIIIVMIKKTKPYLYYITNIILYISVLIMFISSNKIIHNLEIMLVETKTILAIRDIANIARLLQAVSLVFYLIRATGFDIRKFDFVRDLQKLDISEEDSEEYELAVSFEKNESVRKIKRTIRNLKYYYRENKFVLNTLMVLFLVFAVITLYTGATKYTKTYEENEFVNVGSFDIGIKNSYIITKDYTNKTIPADDKILVAVNLSIKSSYMRSIPISRISLSVNNTKYYHQEKYKAKLIDLGKIYKNEIINNEFNDYILVFEIPKEYMKSEMKIKYVDNIDSVKGRKVENAITIKISPVNIDSNNQIVKEYQLSNQIDTKETNLSDYLITINNYEIKDIYESTYTSCINNNECFDYKEILKPSINEKPKTILKLDGTISYENKISSISNLYDYISVFGTIEYKLNGKRYYETQDFNQLTFNKTKNDSIYIEVNKDIMNAEEIRLSFNIRNYKYSYVLKGGV